MIFTDDDLKRLKERAIRHDFSTNSLMSNEHLESLLARLEAAERCITSETDDIANYEAWRKAAGK